MNGVTTAAATAAPTTGARITQASELRSARIESLRALAALCVVASHSFVYSYGLPPRIADRFTHRLAIELGWAGVDVFFALSGYLLFWPFARAAYATGERVSLRRYARNRLLRILPLYYVVLAVLLIVQHGGGSVSQWWHFAAFAQNFDLHTLGKVDAPMWSLAIEVQFYLALPALAIAIAAVARGSRRRAGAILLVLAVGSAVLRELTVWHSSPAVFRVQFSLPSVFTFFAAGMLLALVRLRWLERRPRWLDGPAGRPEVWVAVAIALFILVAWRFSLEPLGAIASLLVVGACVLPLRRGAFVAVMESRPLSRLGVASYSLYLWHVPVIIALSAGSLTASAATLDPRTGHVVRLFGAGAAIAIALAFVSYRVIEATPLRWRRRWAASAAPTRGE